ncbi:hypothetical protein IMY05_014G0080000 [Salix suchowensis]|nr:hypothetical protein IMY05_014G0080000 [Salix suchowensis]
MNFRYNILAQKFKLFSKTKSEYLNMGNFLYMPACLLMKSSAYLHFFLCRGFCVTLTLQEPTCLGKLSSLSFTFRFFSNKRYWSKAISHISQIKL